MSGYQMYRYVQNNLASISTYYKRKNTTNKLQNLAKPKWNCSAIKSHLIQKHSTANDGRSGIESESETDGEEETDTGQQEIERVETGQQDTERVETGQQENERVDENVPDDDVSTEPVAIAEISIQNDNTNQLQTRFRKRIVASQLFSKEKPAKQLKK